MNIYKVALLVLIGLLFFPLVGKAQLELSLKVRGTGFHGAYGKSYAAIGYEPAITIQPGEFWSGGISFSESLLAVKVGSNSAHNLSGNITLINAHIGAKRTMGQYFHPFIYAIAGFRFAEYESSSLTEESNPALSSVSLGYGLKTGLQIGKEKWRFEGSLELLSGTKAKYLTAESFERAYSSGKYREYAERSNMTGVTVAVGVVYMLNWDELVDE